MKAANANLSALRFGLQCTLPRVRRACEHTISSALEAATFGDAARELDVSRRGLERLRADMALLHTRAQGSGKNA